MGELERDSFIYKEREYNSEIRNYIIESVCSSSRERERVPISIP